MFRNIKGFTLIELLLVVLIIGILAGIALPQYQMVIMKSKYSTIMDIVNAINDAEERYYLIHDKYSETFDGLDIDLTGCTLSSNKQICYYDWGNCGISLSSSTDRVHCHNNTSLKNGYVQYLKQGRWYSRYGRSCWAFTNDRNDKYNKLCNNITLHNGNSDNCTGIGPCIIYRF